jgi:hypothetical protein
MKFDVPGPAKHTVVSMVVLLALAPAALIAALVLTEAGEARAPWAVLLLAVAVSAFIAGAHRRRGVVLLPERDGKLILVNVERPHALVDALRSV